MNPRRRIAVIDILSDRASTTVGHLHNYLYYRQFASFMPQTISVWCKTLGHRVTYNTYYGQKDLWALFPDDLDFLFVSGPSNLSHIAYALARRARQLGITTVIGGAHAKSYPSDCLRFFDIVAGDCDKTLLAEIIRSRPVGQVVSSAPPTEFPLVEERLEEIKHAHFYRGRSLPTTVFPLLASTGCPYTCSFCIDHASVYRMMDPDRLVEDLRFINREYPQTSIAFHDPNFGIKFDEVMDAFERAENLNSYGIEVSLSILKKPGRIQRLRDTCCNYVASGVESLLGFHGKQGTSSRNSVRENRVEIEADFLEITQEVGFTQANIIFGLDEDRGDELLDEYASFILSGAASLINLSLPLPFGGTPLYEELRRNGRILPLPFMFLEEGALCMRILNYDAVEYMTRTLGLYRVATSLRSLRAAASIRTRHFGRGVFGATRYGRYTGMLAPKLEDRWTVIPRLQSQLEALSSPRSETLDFYEGRRTALPAHYRARLEERLAPFDGLLDANELLSPILDPMDPMDPMLVPAPRRSLAISA